jgi:hypothetical protein
MFRTEFQIRGTFVKFDSQSLLPGDRPKWLTKRGTGLMLALAMLAILPGEMNSQSQQQARPVRNGPGDAPTTGIDSMIPMVNATGTPDEKLMRMLNAARQHSLVSDTDKLLKLAHELDAEIAAGKSNSPTPSELRKFARIEKLARSVKTGMSAPIIPTTAEEHTSFPVVR